MGLEEAPVVGEVVTGGGDDARRHAEQSQGVGDVAGATAALLAHLLDQEGDVDHVQLVGQDVVLEVAGEDHDVVEGQGAGDDHVAVGADVEGRTSHLVLSS